MAVFKKEKSFLVVFAYESHTDESSLFGLVGHKAVNI